MPTSQLGGVPEVPGRYCRGPVAAFANRYDAMAEWFFATLKTEFCYRRVRPTKIRACLALGAGIEVHQSRSRPRLGIPGL
ncbi:MAG: hypothetical protein DLM58_02610 [Pseudonocardiales bacterium]|nr:MAG: hypothetical protein DLM58_02610 [Pseudonocardiales bacterium]